MKLVAMEEFAAHPARYLLGGEKIEVAHDGRAIGYYLPRPRATPEEQREAMERLQATIARVLAETGMTEDELADLFDTSRPFPYEIDSEMPVEASDAAVRTGSHAPGR